MKNTLLNFISAIGGGGGVEPNLPYPIWLVSEDISYYDELISLPANFPIFSAFSVDIDELLKKYSNGEIKKFGILSPTKPDEKYKEFFIVKPLPNQYGILTTQQKLANIEESFALEQRIGLSVINSPFTLKDVGGAYALKEYVAQLQKAEEKGFRAKGVFLVGIPGTGKTFFPKCFAGELNRLLIQLNLSMIMESAEPIIRLNSVFEYLSERYRLFPDEKYVILIDEIEKMIGNASPIEKRVLGRMLTILNDVGTEASEYSFNAIFFATANDLNTILSNNPEFLRRGRWDELFFINLPTYEFAKDIFNIYIKKFKLQEIFDNVMSLDSVFAEIDEKYQPNNPASYRFCYTSAEIENFCKRLDFVRMGKEVGESINKDDILDSIDMIIPIVISAQEGVSKMLAQRKLFKEI